jgi:hypothetical protein
MAVAHSVVGDVDQELEKEALEAAVVGDLTMRSGVAGKCRGRPIGNNKCYYRFPYS